MRAQAGLAASPPPVPPQEALPKAPDPVRWPLPLYTYLVAAAISVAGSGGLKGPAAARSGEEGQHEEHSGGSTGGHGETCRAVVTGALDMVKEMREEAAAPAHPRRAGDLVLGQATPVWFGNQYTATNHLHIVKLQLYC